MTIRFATREDVAGWFGGRVPSTMRAVVLEQDGRVTAIAGLAQGADGMQAFSEISDESREHKVALTRLAIAFGRLLVACRGPVFAICDSREPTSPGLLSHLGFQQVTSEVWRHG